MLAALGTDEIVSKSGIPISGMAAFPPGRTQRNSSFSALAASSLHAVMHYGFRIIEDLCDGLSNWMDEKDFKTIADVCGHSLHRVSEFKDLDLSYRAVARIDAQKCIKCNLCYVLATTPRTSVSILSRHRHTRPAVLLRRTLQWQTRCR